MPMYPFFPMRSGRFCEQPTPGPRPSARKAGGFIARSDVGGSIEVGASHSSVESCWLGGVGAGRTGKGLGRQGHGSRGHDKVPSRGGGGSAMADEPFQLNRGQSSHHRHAVITVSNASSLCSVSLLCFLFLFLHPASSGPLRIRRMQQLSKASRVEVQSLRCCGMAHVSLVAGSHLAGSAEYSAWLPVRSGTRTRTLSVRDTEAATKAYKCLLHACLS